MRSKRHAERTGASLGASVGASLGAAGGPFGAGIGAGFGGALGFIAGSLTPSCSCRSRLLPDGGTERVDDRPGGRDGTDARPRSTGRGRETRDHHGRDARGVSIPVEER
jgi:hypothetical protein